MSLEPGRKLGPYEIVSPIGAGGMGEVYEARDTRLERTVAIKVLPSHLSGDPELRQRFEREAKAVSGLNHPHICTLYDVGHEDGVDFLVMEHLVGDTLAERLKKGPLPFDQALKFGSQIADALDQAHRHGVIHRDLKPGNVMLTKDGAKLLDFGLAKQQERGMAGEASALSALPTEAKSLTEKGTLLGTFQYMAPEQLEGNPVTPQTDIFAFGALLYEMVTGRKAFEGGSPASLISVIMTAEPPPPSSLQATAPASLDAVIKGCLVKDPGERWQSAGDVSRQLRWIDEGGKAPASVPSAGRTPTRVVSLVTGLLVGAILTGVGAWWLGSRTPALLPTKLVVTVPPSEPLRGNVALSPDGRTLVFVGFRDGVQQIFRRPLDQWDATPVRGTEGGASLSVSPDGDWVAFVTSGSLKKASLSGGEPITLCESCAGSAGTHWGANGRIAFTSEGGVSEIPGAGGTPRTLATLEEGGPGGGLVDAGWLPSGRAVLFTSFGDASIQMLDLETGERRDLVTGRKPRYTSSGHLVFSRGGTLWAVPFDPDKLETRGEPVPVLENVLVNANGFPRFALSPSGTLAYVAGQEEAGTSLVWVDREGRSEKLVEEPGRYLFPRLSPDGRSLTVATPEQRFDTWIFDIERGTRTRVVMEGSNEYPDWTPDGSHVTFVSRLDDGTQGIYSKRADGTGEAELLLEAEGRITTSSWHPNGEILAFEWSRSDVFDLAIRDADGSVSFLEETSFNETAPAFSPDGGYLAYASDESGETEVYVRAFPGPGGKWAISRGGGREPVWSGDGRALFYREGGEVWAVSIELEPEFRAGAATLLFDLPYGVRSGATSTTPNFDVSSDGERFVMIQPADAQNVLTEVRVILNWSEELKRLAPVN